MKLYIVADMEGIAGVVSPVQIGDGDSPEIEQARRQFTDEVNAVCAGALEAGVEEIYINDFHGCGRNLLLERLPSQVMLIRGGFRPTAGFDHLDSTFGGLVLLGAHARSGSREGVIPHTYAGHLRFELFGAPIGEFDILSLVAGEYKVPTILISGDSKTIEQANTNMPATPTVITKYPIGVSSAICIHPKMVCDALREEIKRGVKSAGTIEPPAISPPLQLGIRVSDVNLHDRLSWIPQLKRTSDDRFEFVAESAEQMAKLVYGVTLLTTPGL
ncbi:MAG TPA: M55 family metallopeptidase [Candidatus Ozemobacteraceae bacterium]|nr:M55 family metallopeptidase [Candidatus Ozemobacteraceae bacterium]